jgi:hypothetical protein
MMKSKSSGVSVVCILVTVDLDFFWEEGFEGENFLFLKGSSHLGAVLLHLSSVQLLCPSSLLRRHHPLAQVMWKQSSLRHCLNLGPLQSSFFCWFQVCPILCEWSPRCLVHDHKSLQGQRG